MSSRVVAWIAPLALIPLACGCSPAAKAPAVAPPAAGDHDHDHDHDHGHDHGHDHDHDHDHGHDHAEHAHPQTLAAGIAELEQAVGDVATALAEGTDEAADDAVHAIGHLVDDLRGLLAKQEGLADDAKAAGTQALDEIFTAFNTLDEALHSDADDAKAKVREAHDTVKDSITKAVAALKAQFSKESE